MASKLSNWDYANTRRLFVYGSLIEPQFFARLAGKRYEVLPEEAVPPNSGLVAIPAVLRDYRKWKPRQRYSSAKRHRGEKIEGLLIFRLTGGMLQLLDQYEGKKYRRKSVTVTTHLGPLVGECYLASRSIPPRLPQSSPIAGSRIPVC